MVARSVASARGRLTSARGGKDTGVAFAALGLTVLLSLVVAAACSSGIDSDPPGQDIGPAGTGDRGNVSFGFDPGFALTHPITSVDVTGGVVKTAGGGEKSLAFFAFTTRSDADDGDGQGNALDRGGAIDANGAPDVFLAAVVDTDIDPAAFMSGLVQTFRHPRCMTCHSMNFADTLAFRSAEREHPGGRPPLNPDDTDDNAADGGTCAQCHTNVDDWRAPIGSKDFRTKTARELFDTFTDPGNLPEGESLFEHFTRDPRIDWALGEPDKNGQRGRLPTGFAPLNGIADDDHDSVREPEDTDGVARTVPGGKPVFTAQIQAFLDGGMKFSSADTAVNDIVLCSQSQVGGTAADGASFAPSLQYAPDPAFDPRVAGSRAGSVFVAFASDATDLAAGDNRGTDVFRVRVDVILQTNGRFDLQMGEPAVLVSVPVSAMGRPGASLAPSIGGSEGEVIAFESDATNVVVGFVEQNATDEPDVFVRDLVAGTTTLVSRSIAGPTIGGSGGGSSRPAVSPDGSAVTFDSAATDLVADDTNRVRDVFYALFANGRRPGNGVTALRRASVTALRAQAGGGDSRRASIVVHDVQSGDVSVVFESDKTDLVDATPRATTTNVYLHRPTRGPRTALLNQRFGPRDAAPVLGSASAVDGSAAPADAFAPQLGPDGKNVVFQTLADNLDVLRPSDLNRAPDVVIVDLAQLDSNGFLLPSRISVSGQGADADGGSRDPVFAGFAGASPKSRFAAGLLTYTTEARNTGASDRLGNVIVFVNETSGARAEFTAEPLSGGTAELGRITGGAPFTVRFTNLSRGDANGFRWDFGDPRSERRNVSTQRDPTHRFDAPGSYTVTLRMHTESGILTETKSAFIRAFGQPVAAFDVSPRKADVQPFMVEFTDRSTEEPFEWSWDFDGDGVIDSTEQNPSHRYDSPGEREVRLTVRGFGGTSETTTDRITVFARVDADFTPDSRVVVDDGDPVAFRDRSTGTLLPTGAWRWNFGDPQSGTANTSTEQDPTHTFSGPGSYTVSLNVTGRGTNNIDTQRRADLVVVQGELFSDFDGSPRVGIAQITTAFQDRSSGSVPVTSWLWDFGDPDSGPNNTSTAQNPNHVYAHRGTDPIKRYTVTLTVTGPNGEVGTKTETDFITVYQPVDAMFTADPTSGATPLTVRFQNTTSGAADTWSWTFGDGGTSGDRDPVHTFTGQGTLTVRLEASGPGGTDSASLRIRVAPGFNLVYPILRSRCRSCHSGNSAPGGLDFRDEATAYRELVGPNPDRPSCSGEDHVREGNASGSYLVKKIEGRQRCGSRMPPSGESLSGSQITLIRSWISSGAQR